MKLNSNKIQNIDDFSNFISYLPNLEKLDLQINKNHLTQLSLLGSNKNNRIEIKYDKTKLNKIKDINLEF